MTIVVLENQLSTFEKIIKKNTSTITFKDVVSLIFYAAEKMSGNEAQSEIWKNYYEDFQKELNAQNKRTWPKLLINRNDYAKRMDIYSSESFIKSENILMLLLRLLYIENYKRSYVYKSYNYHKILSYKMVIPLETEITKLSMTDLFDLLKVYMKYYHKIYNDSVYVEYQLGKVILEQLAN